MAANTSDLLRFRLGLEPLMRRPDLRPFTCSGSPLSCEVFVVGLNSATTLPKAFWTYWSDDTGFNREQFEADYVVLRKKHGVRPRIERFVRGARPLACLETNVFSTPTKKARDLRVEDRDSSIFLYLVNTVRPRAIFVHSDEPIAFFEERTGARGFCEGTPVLATFQGVDFLLLGLRGPLYTKAAELAERMGHVLAQAVSESGHRVPGEQVSAAWPT